MSASSPGGNRTHLLTLQPSFAEAARVRAFVHQLAEELAFSPERVFDMQVAVSEAVANAIEHAHGSGEVRVELEVSGDRLEVRVVGPGEFHLPARGDSREHRGLGLPLMASLSDHLALYSVAEGGTLVALSFYLPGAAHGTSARSPSLAELLAESRLLPEVLDNLPEAFVVFDREWRYVFVNAAHVGLSRRPKEDLLGRAFEEVFPEALTTRDEHGVNVYEQYQQAREEGRPRRFFFHHRAFGRWFEYQTFPVTDGLAVFARDATEEKRAEEERANAALFPEENPFPVLRVTREGTLLYANLSAQPLLAQWGSAVSRRVPESVERAVALALETGERQELEALVADRSLSLVLVPVVERGYVNFYGRDVTENQRAEERLAFQAALLDQVGDAVVATDGDLRVTYWNDMAQETFGWTKEEALGQDAGELLQTKLEGLTREDALAELLKAGRFEGEASYRRKDGTVFVAHLRSAVLRDPGGQMKGLVTSVRDVTERKRSEQEREALRNRYLVSERQRRRRMEALLRVTEVALAEFDTGEAAQKVLEYLVQQHGPELADVWLERGEVLELAAERNYPPSYRERFSPMPLSAPYDAARVFQTGTPVVVPDLSQANPSMREMYEAIGVKRGAYLILPLRSRGKTIGTLHFGWHKPWAIEQEDVDFYSSIANELGVVLENARLYEAERTVANHLQRALLSVPRRVEGIEFGHTYRTASEAGKVGGDFYDVFALPDGTVGALMGDVSGHGLSAATLASFCRETIRAYALHNHSPRYILRLTNQTLIHRHGYDQFITLVLVLLDPATGKLRYSLAGHPPPVQVSPRGASVARWKPCPPLGVFEDAHFLTGRSTLDKDATLVFYTDGITEARREGNLFGEARLTSVLSLLATENPEVVARRVLEEVTEYAQGDLRDDAAVLVVRLERAEAHRAGARTA